MDCIKAQAAAGPISSKNEKVRMDWLDALRALAMLFVIYGHLNKQYEFFLFTSPVKIPLFFAISGYLMYGKLEDIKAFFQRMCHRIIIPWLILSLGFGLRFILTQGIKFYIDYAVEVLIGKELWYMICCIIAQILFYFAQRLVGSGWKLGITVLLLTGLGLTISSLGKGEMFQINTALICQFYLLSGYWLNKYKNKLNHMKLWMCLALLGAYVALAVGSAFLFPKQVLDVHRDVYYNIPYCFLLITVGCVSLFACAQRVKKYPRCLCAIGQNTLVFYIHDIFWRGMAARGFSLLGITVPKTWYGALIWLVVSCVGCGFEAYILNKLFPEANGKKRKNKTTQE